MQALERHLPAGVTARYDEHYDVMDEDAYLDVFYPSNVANIGRSLSRAHDDIFAHGFPSEPVAPPRVLP